MQSCSLAEDQEAQTNITTSLLQFLPIHIKYSSTHRKEILSIRIEAYSSHKTVVCVYWAHTCFLRDIPHSDLKRTRFPSTAYMICKWADRSVSCHEKYISLAISECHLPPLLRKKYIRAECEIARLFFWGRCCCILNCRLIMLDEVLELV